MKKMNRLFGFFLIIFMAANIYANSVVNVNTVPVRLGYTTVSLTYNGITYDNLIVAGRYGTGYMLVGDFTPSETPSNPNLLLDPNNIYICGLSTTHDAKNSTDLILCATWSGSVSDMIKAPGLTSRISSYDQYTYDDNTKVTHKFLRAVIVPAPYPNTNDVILYMTCPSPEGNQVVSGKVLVQPIDSSNTTFSLTWDCTGVPDSCVNVLNIWDMDVIDLNATVVGNTPNATNWGDNNYIEPLLVFYTSADVGYGMPDQSITHSIIINQLVFFNPQTNEMQTYNDKDDNIDKNDGENAPFKEDYINKCLYGRSITGPGMVWIGKDGNIAYTVGVARWNYDVNYSTITGLMNYHLSWYVNAEYWCLGLDPCGIIGDDTDGNPINGYTINLAGINSDFTASAIDCSTGSSAGSWNSGGTNCYSYLTVRNSIANKLYPGNCQLMITTPAGGLVYIRGGDITALGTECKGGSSETTFAGPINQLYAGFTSDAQISALQGMSIKLNTSDTPHITDPKVTADFLENYDPTKRTLLVMFGWPYTRVSSAYNEGSSLSAQGDIVNNTVTSNINGYIAAVGGGPGGIVTIQGNGTWVNHDVTIDSVQNKTTMSLTMTRAPFSTSLEAWSESGFVLYSNTGAKMTSYVNYTAQDSPAWIPKNDGTGCLLCNIYALSVIPIATEVAGNIFTLDNTGTSMDENSSFSSMSYGLGINETDTSVYKKPGAILTYNSKDAQKEVQPAINSITDWQKAVNLKENLTDLINVPGSGVTPVIAGDGVGFLTDTKQKYTLSISQQQTDATTHSAITTKGVKAKITIPLVPKILGIGLGGAYEQNTGTITNISSTQGSGINLQFASDQEGKAVCTTGYMLYINPTEYKTYWMKKNNAQSVPRPFFIPLAAWINNDNFILILPFMPDNESEQWPN